MDDAFKNNFHLAILKAWGSSIWENLNVFLVHARILLVPQCIPATPATQLSWEDNHRGEFTANHRAGRFAHKIGWLLWINWGNSHIYPTWMVWTRSNCISYTSLCDLKSEKDFSRSDLVWVSYLCQEFLCSRNLPTIISKYHQQYLAQTYSRF